LGISAATKKPSLVLHATRYQGGGVEIAAKRRQELQQLWPGGNSRRSRFPVWYWRQVRPTGWWGERGAVFPESTKGAFLIAADRLD
jgi:hypothetical protein